jgi:hypothetical protein
MKKLCVLSIMAISLTALQASATIHGGTNPKPGKLIKAAEGTVFLRSEHRIAEHFSMRGTPVIREF